MACKTSFELYHNFPKLAEESGFTFNTHRPRVHIEWHKIKLVDIDSLIRERKFTLIEQHVNDILDCVLESEFDVRILDEGVLKIFRLAQLAVEYQQFCRHYLDRSVYVLREEVTSLVQELDSMKRVLKEKEEEIRKLKRKSKRTLQTSLPYGNENIATMILKTLSNKNDMFPNLGSPDTMYHNKCTYCDKVFLNQLYLQSHMSRRHRNVTEIPQKDTDKNQTESSNDENYRLNNEIIALKSKLEDMEKLITNSGNGSKSENMPIKKSKSESQTLKEMKDVEVSTNSEGFILDKIEEWKKEEQDRYNKELNLLRTQILAMMDSFKEKEQETTKKTDINIMNELNATIKHQGLEIAALKQELINSKPIPKNTEEIAQRKEMEEQMSHWVKRAELQSKEYNLLLQKLDVVAKEAEKSRVQAETERARVLELQNLLQQQQRSHANNDKNNTKPTMPETTITLESTVTKNSYKPNSICDSLSIQQLQQKAQELLNIDNLSTSGNSDSSDTQISKTEEDNKNVDINHTCNPIKQEYRTKRKTKQLLRKTNAKESAGEGIEKAKNKFHLRDRLRSIKKNGMILPGSPVKIVRSKITEEVNRRLVELGVDPLKARLPEYVFSKQKRQLQEQQQKKFKKYPRTEQVFHSLRTHLDSNATGINTIQTDIHHHSSRKNKAFTLSSVISNVKTKALSFVKTNVHSKNDQKTYDSVAKKAMMLLKTPPTSTNSSPKLQTPNSPDQSKMSQPSKEPRNKSISMMRTLSAEDKRFVRNDEIDTEYNINNNGEDEYYMEHHASSNIKKIAKSPIMNSLDVKSSNFTKYDVLTASPTTKLTEIKHNNGDKQKESNENSSDDVESILDYTPRRAYSVENISKQTKGVLKNASSTSSLNKKKVIFDMDAIQMKSVSVSSPSQSITEKSNKNEKYDLGLINLDSEEWDISSIENDPVVQKKATIVRTSPKIAELRESIESQLARRNNTMSTAVVGGVDILPGPSVNKTAASSKGGSNTSLGSSILDDTDSTPTQNHVAFVKPRTIVEKDDSEMDISEFVTDDIVIKNIAKSQ